MLGLWLAWVGSAVSGPPPPPPIAIAWRALDGHLLVLRGDGSQLQVFGPRLETLHEATLGFRADALGIAADGGWRLRDEQGGSHSWDPDRGSRDAAPPPTGWLGGVECPGPAGRRFHVDPVSGRIWLGLAEWEHPGEVEWGPGWATVRIRSSRRLLRHLQWRDPAGQVREVAFVPDGRDPLLQRAWLEPIPNGSWIELRRPPARWCYPEMQWGPWERLAVPEVDPAGARPVTVLADLAAPHSSAKEKSSVSPPRSIFK